MKKRIIAMVLALVLAVSCAFTLASCGYDVVEFSGDYTYNDSVSTMATNWNPHTYQTSDDSYPISFITTGLYGFFFNDGGVYEVDGKDPYEGYVIVPEMAAKDPKDVTEKIRDKYPQYGIPASAESGYAYEIKLNKDACWEDGTPINAETYVYSMKALLDPVMQNYRGIDYFDGDFCIANAKNYYYQGQTIFSDGNNYAKTDYTKNADGQWLSPDGNPMFVAVGATIGYFDNENSLADYVDYYGSAYFSTTYWEQLKAKADADGYAPLTDETYAWIVDVITGNPNWSEDESYIYNYLAEKVVYAADYSFESNVGIFASGEYEITIVLGKSLAGFNLYYNLSGNWIVYKDLYEACKSKDEATGVWSTTYNTSKETTMSYGPYKMTEYVLDKSMTFEKNETWFGYTDGKHEYQDPNDGLYYPMYQTNKIFCQVVTEAETRKMMFLKGQLMGYGLQSEDFAEYRDSDFCYATPSETIFFFIFNGHKEAIETREAAEGFDKATKDLETMTLQSFRKAVAVTYDKEALCTAVSPSRSGGYGLIGNSYIYDPETGARYRDTDQAKKALCDFYSVDVSKFESLDAAVASITGYDVVAAKALYTQAYNEALAAGYITDANGDGKSDQTIEITYASSSSSAFITKTLAYLNEKMAEVLVGTPFEGKIMFVESAPLGNDWSTELKAGMADTCLAGWSGSALNPFSLTDLYTNSAKQYDAEWFDASAVSLTLNVNVAGIDKKADKKDVTMTLKQWSDALNGSTVTVGGVDYCFGDGIADVETRLDILAAIEARVLQTYNYIPMLQDASMALLSQQVYYVVDEYNPIMGRGGIAYLKYNYNDTEWKAFVDSQEGGVLKY